MDPDASLDELEAMFRKMTQQTEDESAPTASSPPHSQRQDRQRKNHDFFAGSEVTQTPQQPAESKRDDPKEAPPVLSLSLTLGLLGNTATPATAATTEAATETRHRAAAATTNHRQDDHCSPAAGRAFESVECVGP